MNVKMMREIAKEIYRKEKEDKTFDAGEVLEAIMVKEGIFIGAIVQNEYGKLKQKEGEEIV